MASPDTQSSKQASKRVCLGRIAAPHGVKGLVKILPYGEDPTLIQSLSPVFTSSDKNNTVDVVLKNGMGKYILAEVIGCNSREGSDELKGTELWVERDALPAVDNEDEFYIEDLIGLTAVNAEADHLGTIHAVQNYGAGDMLEIKPKSGASYFVPFQDEYVTEIDLDQKRIEIINSERFIIE